MNVTYTCNGQEATFDVTAEDDLQEITEEIEEHLRENHPELADNPQLPILIADGVLNSLSDDSEEINIGELSGAA